MSDQVAPATYSGALDPAHQDRPRRRHPVQTGTPMQRASQTSRQGESAKGTTASSRAAAPFWTGLGCSCVGRQLDRIRLSEVGRAAYRGPFRGFGELSLRVVQCHRDRVDAEQ